MTTTIVSAGTWTVDAATRAGFAVRNFGVMTVRGTIAVTAGTVTIGPHGEPVRLSGTLDPASIDTGNPRRDADLRGGRFLDVEHHPLMEVLADRIERTADGWRAHAVLRVAGAQTPLLIDGTLVRRSPADRLVVTATARLHLPDVGIRPPRFLVGHQVDLAITAQLGSGA